MVDLRLKILAREVLIIAYGLLRYKRLRDRAPLGTPRKPQNHAEYDERGGALPSLVYVHVHALSTPLRKNDTDPACSDRRSHRRFVTTESLVCLNVGRQGIG